MTDRRWRLSFIGGRLYRLYFLGAFVAFHIATPGTPHIYVHLYFVFWHVSILLYKGEKPLCPTNPGE